MNDQRLGLCTLLLLLASAAVLPGCSVDDDKNPAYRDPDCKSKPYYRGFCVPDAGHGDVTAPGDAAVATDAAAADAAMSTPPGKDAAVDAGDVKPSNPSLAGKACNTDGDEALCYDGPDSTKAKGACVSGVQKCTGGTWSECFGQVLPSDEMCNGNDDDCDGQVDEDAAGDCVAPGTGCTGVLVCEQGRSICAATVDPLAEACNGLDDDCDGKTDEDTDQVCADDNLGCSADSAGHINCKGICSAGVRHCNAGKLESACSGQTKPDTQERCGAQDSVAVDEDCDGHFDETCTCSGSGSRSCHNGPDTPPVGACKLGTQMCTGGAWGACEGEVTPEPEACPNDNTDDDCNGAIDDVPGLGSDCASAALGRCHNGKQQCVGGVLRCVTPSPVDEVCNGVDDDCNGKTDEAFQLPTDENNCGRCGMNCPNNSTCCNGMCVDVETSSGHCGMCNHVCGSGFSCCGATCVNFQNDKANCGSCGHACGASETCCSGACLNLANDATHCGTCTKACALNIICLGGGCLL